MPSLIYDREACNCFGLLDLNESTLSKFLHGTLNLPDRTAEVSGKGVLPNVDETSSTGSSIENYVEHPRL
jgi:hypothetical protein